MTIYLTDTIPQRLHDILQNADSYLLNSWARDNPCQVDSLAVAILEGLELWPFTINILSILCLWCNLVLFPVFLLMSRSLHHGISKCGSTTQAFASRYFACERNRN